MQDFTIKFAGYQAHESILNQSVKVFEDALRDRVGDALSFDFTRNIMEHGHKAADLLTLVESGEQTMCYFSSSYLGERVPELGILDLPFVINDRIQAYKILDHGLGPALAKKLEACSDYKVLGFWDNGFRHLSNARRPVSSPEDCKGLRLRTMFSAMHQQAFRLLGFDANPLDVKDMITALKEDTIDAQENALTNIYNFKISKAHPHITLTRQYFGTALFLCHRPTYETWSEDVRRAVGEAAAIATSAQRELAVSVDVDVLAKLEADGNKIVHLTEQQRNAFIEALSPLLDEQRARFGDDLIDCVLSPDGCICEL